MSHIALVLTAYGVILFLIGVVVPIAWRPGPHGHQAGRQSKAAAEGRITVVIAAYLEASVIGGTVAKLKLQLGRRAAGSGILVVASDQETADAARAAGADVLIQPAAGKPSAVNAGVFAAPGDVVVLSDANCTISPDDWPRLLLDDLEVAALVSAIKAESRGPETAFFAYERRVKGLGATGLVDSIAAAGEFVAFRKADFEAIPALTLLDDLETAISFDRRGLRTVVDSRIVTTEEPAAFWDQVERRTRITAGLIETALGRCRILLSTSNGRQYLVHKVYRSTVGAAGFWLMVAGSMWIHPPVTLVVPPIAVLAAFAVYRYEPVWVATPLRAAAAAISLQVVPVLAVGRLLSRMRRRNQAGWKKVRR